VENINDKWRIVHETSAIFVYLGLWLYNAHGCTSALADGARELRSPTFEKAQFVTALGIILRNGC